MVRKAVLWMIWISFVAYTVWLAPLDRSYTWDVGYRLITFRWGEINAYLLSIFWLMGVWPLIYASLMLVDGRMQPFRVWPYFIGSNFTGVICLLPYLLLRQRNQTFNGTMDKWLAWLERRSTGVMLLFTAIALIAYALIVGDWADFVQQFQTRHFVHLISLDFCLMCLVFPITSLFDDDMARRGISNRAVFWAVALVPLFGPLFYLCWRSPLQKTVSSPTRITDTQFQ
ncbi:DUF2834 domain-containing protein [Oculatella sp. FACHB-28]|nr:DUF2834 domain-containing protein [Oculatella sp. FACHB-28]